MNRRSLVLLALGGLSLLGGLTGALVLLGLGLGGSVVRLGAAHGLLMVLGFLGTMIALERAVALGRTWAYASPLGAGLGAIGLLLGLSPIFTGALLLAGGLVFVALYVAFERLQPALHIHAQAVAAVAWPAAVLLWLAGRPVSDIVPWLAAFLVLIIAGERLELSRLGELPRRAQMTFVAAAAVLAVGVVLTVVAPDAGARMAGLGLVLLAAWLASHDLARRTVRMGGITRFIAVCLLIGYGWLALGGAIWVVGGASTTAVLYDARLHAIFLGFVMSMVFGHAPVIIPAVLRVPLPYHRRFYGHLALLHGGLIVRIIGGDLLAQPVLWQAGGVINVVALLVFVGSSAAAVAGGLRGRRQTVARRAAAAVDRTGPERSDLLVQ